jgi:sugar lactone lactonase YvrE
MTDTADLLLEATCETGESPVWDERTGELWWTDIPGQRMHRIDSASGETEAFSLPGRVGSFAFRRTGGFVLALEHGFALWDGGDSRPAMVAEPERALVDHRFNDGRCDRQGRFLAGSMNMARSGPTAQLWRLDPDRATMRVAGDVTVANGLAFSPDGRLMYWADSTSERVWQFDYDIDTGTVRNRRLWLDSGDAPGHPDGGCVDADGCYWSARWHGGRVVRFTPSGTVDRIVHLPVSRVTMCAFGGPDLRTLFITTARENMTATELADEPLAGSLFAVQADVAGLPEPRFAG